MAHAIKFREEIWTKDDKKLGVARSIHHRPEDVDPTVKQYDAYLEIEDFELGMSYYVPLEYIQERDENTDRTWVTVPFNKVLQNTWTRQPKFVASGRGTVEKLPRG